MADERRIVGVDQFPASGKIISVESTDPTSDGVCLIEIGKLMQESNGLERVDPTISSPRNHDVILAAPTILPQLSNSGGKLGVVADDRASISNRS